MKLREAIEAAPQPPEAVQPGDGPLHEPPECPQATAMRPTPRPQDRRDPQPAQQRAQRPGVVAGVALQAVGPFPLRPRLAADRRLVGEHVQGLRDLIDVGGGHRGVERDAVRVGQDVVLAAGLAAVRGVGAGVLAPSGALQKEASISARDQSIRSAPLSSASSRACSRCQTPARYHSRR